MTSSQQIRKSLGCSGSVPQAGKPGTQHVYTFECGTVSDIKSFLLTLSKIPRQPDTVFVQPMPPGWYEKIQKFIEESTTNGITPKK